jgi:DNA-binding transcriptional MocR family regulator
MPMHRRRQLLNLANDYGVPVLEDAVYHEFRFEGEALPPLKALDTTDNVFHVSAYTKMLLPGMRIGYLIATNNQFERLVRVKQAADISTSGLNQRVIHLMIQRGVIAQQLERNNRELRRRRDAAIEAAQKYFPAGTEWEVPQGGVYLWASLPQNGPTAAELFITAVQKQVSFAIGNVFYSNGRGARNIRLNYGLQRPELIDLGFRRLGEAWRELSEKYSEIESSPLL